jgi:16S rRNA (guanine527-N7)-methyltransferase
MEQLGNVYVSRETLADLKVFKQLVRKWNPAINLVAKSSLPEVWERHIVDSIQIFPLVTEEPDLWLDIGSGGGFPGIVVAILAKGLGWSTKFHLVESDNRKSVFLRTAARDLKLNVEVSSDRIEAVERQNADILTARALKSLDELLIFTERHLAQGGAAIFPKGKKWQEEITLARANWRFEVEPHQSITDGDAKILVLSEIVRD